MHCTRRSFMGVTLAGVGALALPRPVSAAGSRNLIVVFARGAWDPVWTIDPKVKAQTADIDLPDGVITKFPNNISVLTDKSRLNVGTFFDNHADKCAIIRGIDVGSIAHFSAHVRMMTGARSELKPDIGAIAAVELGADLALPYADIGGGAYAGPFAAQMGRLGKRNQLVTLLNRDNAFAPATQVDYAQTPLFVPKTGEAAKIRAYVDARADEASLVRGAQGDNQRRLADYRACFQRADDLRGIPELQELGLSGAGALVDQVKLALKMLKTSSRAVYLDSGQDWDTHNDIADQGIAANALFGDLHKLMTELEAAKLLANTTVVVMSEMGRTPRLNGPLPTAGKDHWPITSAMVLGAGVKPGAYGGTDNKLNARTIDLDSGAVKDGKDPLRYDNFAAGVLKLVGIDPEEWLPDAKPMQGFIA